MVVSAQGPSSGSLPSGTLLKTGAVLDLKAGDHVTVFQSGGTRRFDGPGRFLPQQPSTAARTALASLISQSRPEGASRIGAVRGFGTSATGAATAVNGPAGLWQVDVARPGAFCIAQGQTAQLWRSNGKPAKTVITRVSDNMSTDVTWPANVQVVDWPSKLPTTSGDTYTISTAGGADAGVTWRAVPEPTGDWTAFVTALSTAGCKAQLETLKYAVAEK